MVTLKLTHSFELGQMVDALHVMSVRLGGDCRGRHRVWMLVLNSVLGRRVKRLHQTWLLLPHLLGRRGAQLFVGLKLFHLTTAHNLFLNDLIRPVEFVVFYRSSLKLLCCSRTLELLTYLLEYLLLRAEVLVQVWSLLIQHHAVVVDQCLVVRVLVAYDQSLSRYCVALPLNHAQTLVYALRQSYVRLLLGF
jgi:hypothetical protein